MGTKVLQTRPETRILTISVDDDETAIAALRAGAIGHIDKETDPSELAGLIVRAADGEAIVPERLVRQLLKLVREVPSAGWRPLRSRLTTREWEVIDLLAQGASTQHVAEQLVLSTTTIYSHIRPPAYPFSRRPRPFAEPDLSGRREHLTSPAVLAMELIPVIRARLAQLRAEGSGALAGGQRAALWRAQQHAAHTNHTLDDLRHYCLEALRPRLVLDEADENDYLRGYRRGFQDVLTEIRRIETRRPPG